MRVEAECNSFGSMISEDSLKTHVIEPATWKGIGFLGYKTNIVIFCSQDGKRGSVLINDPEEKVSAVRFENARDEESERMNTNSGIEVTGNQLLLIFTRGAKSVKQIAVSLNSDDGQSQEENSQAAFDFEKAEPPSIAS